MGTPIDMNDLLQRIVELERGLAAIKKHGGTLYVTPDVVAALSHLPSGGVAKTPPLQPPLPPECLAQEQREGDGPWVALEHAKDCAVVVPQGKYLQARHTNGLISGVTRTLKTIRDWTAGEYRDIGCTHIRIVASDAQQKPAGGASVTFTGPVTGPFTVDSVNSVFALREQVGAFGPTPPSMFSPAAKATFNADNRWKHVVIDALISHWALKDEHHSDPHLAVRDLQAAQARVCLNPEASSDAEALVARGRKEERAKCIARLRSLSAPIGFGQSHADAWQRGVNAAIGALKEMNE
jgi:hypothetical protein